MPQNTITPTLETPLQYTSLPLRASNILRRHHIETVGELMLHSKEELKHLHGFGKACLAAVDELILQVGNADINETTLEAMKEAEKNSSLEDFDFDAFSRYVESSVKKDYLCNK